MVISLFFTTKHTFSDESVDQRGTVAHHVKTRVMCKAPVEKNGTMDRDWSLSRNSDPTSGTILSLAEHWTRGGLHCTGRCLGDSCTMGRGRNETEMAREVYRTCPKYWEREGAFATKSDQRAGRAASENWVRIYLLSERLGRGRLGRQVSALKRAAA